MQTHEHTHTHTHSNAHAHARECTYTLTQVRTHTESICPVTQTVGRSPHGEVKQLFILLKDTSTYISSPADVVQGPEWNTEHGKDGDHPVQQVGPIHWMRFELKGLEDNHRLKKKAEACSFMSYAISRSPCLLGNIYDRNRLSFHFFPLHCHCLSKKSVSKICGMFCIAPFKKKKNRSCK